MARFFRLSQNIIKISTYTRGGRGKEGGRGGRERREGQREGGRERYCVTAEKESKHLCAFSSARSPVKKKALMQDEGRAMTPK